MAVTQDYCLYLFGEYNRKLSAKPIVVHGVDMSVVYPEVIKQFEIHPLGKITAIIVYDEVNNFEGRFTAKDYLEHNIPRRTN